MRKGTILTFFHSEENFSFKKHDRKIIPTGLQTVSTETFYVRILIILWPCALFRLRFLIVFQILHVESSTVVGIKGILLLLLTREHFLVKKPSKSSVFSLKPMSNLPLCNRSGTQGIFLSFRKVLSYFPVRLRTCFAV